MSLVDDLAELLDAEHAAIRQGKFEDLAQLVARKSELLTALATDSPDPESLAKLKRRAEKNAALLEAAKRGFGAALSQIAQARTAATHKTYGPAGQRDALGPSAKRVEKRC